MSNNATDLNVAGSNWRTPPMAALWLAFAILGGMIFFWDGIVSLIAAWSKPEYSHGPLIPVIAGFLILR